MLERLILEPAVQRFLSADIPVLIFKLIRSNDSQKDPFFVEVFHIEVVSKVFEATLVEMVLFGIFRSDLGCLEASKSSEKSQFFLSVVNLHHGECFGSSDLPSQIENLKSCSNSRTVWQCGWLTVVGKRCCCETVAFRERLQCVKIWL